MIYSIKEVFINKISSYHRETLVLVVQKKKKKQRRTKFRKYGF